MFFWYPSAKTKGNTAQRALCSHRQARLGGSTDLGGEIAFQERNPAQSEPFDVDPFVTPFLKEGEDIRVHPREEFEDRDPVGVAGLEPERGGGCCLHRPQLQAEGVYLPDILLINTGGTFSSRPGENGLAPELSSSEIGGLLGGYDPALDIHAEDYCSLDSITVGTHEANPTMNECTDCKSFQLKA